MKSVDDFRGRMWSISFGGFDLDHFPSWIREQSLFLQRFPDFVIGSDGAMKWEWSRNFNEDGVDFPIVRVQAIINWMTKDRTRSSVSSSSMSKDTHCFVIS